MAVTASMLWFVDSDDPLADLRLGVVNDHEAASALVHTVYPDAVVEPRGDITLDQVPAGHPDEIAVGVFGRLAVIAGGPVATATPSVLPAELIGARPAATVFLVHTDADRSFGAFARWEDGELRRSFSADPITIVENEGLPFIFEKAFWSGEHPLRYADGVQPDPQALPFHPIHFADTASLEWIGFRPTRPFGADIGPDRIPVTRFVIRPPGYQPGEATDRPGPDAPADLGADTGAEQSDSTHGGNRVARWFGFGKR